MRNKPKAKTTSVSSAKTLPTSDVPSPAVEHRQPPVIDVDDLAVHTGRQAVLRDVSFCVHAGEFVVLSGPNGAGKTTLLRTLLGLTPASKGKVLLAPHTRVGYVPQRGAAAPNTAVPLSVLEVVKLGSRGATKPALDALGQVDMAGLAQRRFQELSGGQQQRVAIAKALASGADLLLMDEPTTGIDMRSQQDFVLLLWTLHRRGLTIIMVSHDLKNTLMLGERVLYLNLTLQYDGPAAEFDSHDFDPGLYHAEHRRLHHHATAKPRPVLKTQKKAGRHA